MSAAEAGPKVADALRVAIQASLRGQPSADPRDLSYLLDGLHELLVDAKVSVTDEKVREYLVGSTRGGNTEKLRRLLLALN